jgi:phosphoglycerate dehydrogenase-like enzyme
MPAHAALQEKRIRGAALDVFETEPLPENSPLYELDNCLLSPHCADRTARWDLSNTYGNHCRYIALEITHAKSSEASMTAA